MELAIIKESDIAGELDALIRVGLCACFPEDVGVFSTTRTWHGVASVWSVVLRDRDAVAAHVGVVDRVVLVGDTRLRVAGIQNVFVLPAYRGMGLSDRVMLATTDEALHLDFDCGLLFCVPKLENVYARCGWRTEPDRAITRVDEYAARVPLPDKNITMFYPMKCAQLPVGPIDLCGNDW
ncbi:MAG: GNAT family N-acetyltransferase [Armatimonadetes bacterium]|nr:GNAT family N-acetyltransferase [Armatimonadota bacterium]